MLWFFMWRILVFRQSEWEYWKNHMFHRKKSFKSTKSSEHMIIRFSLHSYLNGFQFHKTWSLPIYHPTCSVQLAVNRGWSCMIITRLGGYFFKWGSVLYFFLETGNSNRPNSFCIVIYEKFVLGSSFFHFRSHPVTSQWRHQVFTMYFGNLLIFRKIHRSNIRTIQ